jgi:uncharacterized protein
MFSNIKIIFLVFWMACILTSCVNIEPQLKPQNQLIESKKFVTSTQTPKNIALLLPLRNKGELGATSQAIYNGFLAAYYSSSQKENIHIQVIDVSDGDIRLQYQKAVDDGADRIIGPLTKTDVEIIASIGSLPVPTIALNTLDDYQDNVIHNLYQFGLSPQDEALQTAEKMAQSALKNTAIIVPEGAWGDKIAKVFKKQYESFGGNIVATLQYHSGVNLAEQICSFLVSDADKICGIHKNKTKQQRLPFGNMLRQDIDSIFFVATTPVQARQVVPLIRFYYANNLPIYSISSVYSGTSRPDLDQDINNIYFCDMPWVIENPNSYNAKLQETYKQIMGNQSWMGSYAKYSKLYALGIDAYELAINLRSGIDGASGVLYLDNFNHISRALQWVQIRNNSMQKI